MPETLRLDEIRLPIGKGIAGYVAETGEVLSIKDAYNDPRFNPEIDLATGYFTRNVLCAPLISINGKTIGVIQLLNKCNNEDFDDYDIELLKAFCAQAAVLYENACLFEENEKTLSSFLKTLAKVIDARDPVTAGHSERVAAYAKRIGTHFDLSEARLKILDYAAALHDIGKIGIRDDILLKPSSFTEKEREIIKTHAKITQDILEQMYFSPELRSIPHIASSHHERLDGSGYPQGLKKDQISFLARILGVADVYDALVSYDRPYKRAFSQQEALEILVDGRGIGFDPDIVDTFFIKHLYLDEQRAFARIRNDFYIDFKPLVTSQPLASGFEQAKTIDVSANGLLFSLDYPLKEGRYLELTLHLPHYDLPLIAKTVRCIKEDGTYSIALSFINLNDEMKARLAEYLTQIEI